MHGGLGVEGRNGCEVQVGSAHLPQTKLGELLIILGFFGVGEKQSWTFLGAKGRCAHCWISGSPAMSQGLPSEQRSKGDEQKGHFWKLQCQSFGLGFTLIHRLSKVRFFWLRGGKFAGPCAGRTSALREPGNPALVAQVSGAGLHLHCPLW